MVSPFGPRHPRALGGVAPLAPAQAWAARRAYPSALGCLGACASDCLSASEPLAAVATLRDTAAAWLAHGQSAILVEVREARGSAPRQAGTRMLVSAADFAGSVGGGHLEWQAIATARSMLDQAELAPSSQHYPLGPALGQCCGGAVTLGFSRLDASALNAWPEPQPRFELQLYGAGHVGRAIVRALAPLHVRVDWIDEREEEFGGDALAPLGPLASSASLASPASLAPLAGPNALIRTLCVDTVEAEVRNARPGAFYLVLTHQHDLDLRITEAILRRGDFAYLGLIGSKTKRQRFVHRFEQRGIAAESIARMTCPIGVPGITGKEPEVIAAAVVAQLLQVASRAESPQVKESTAPENH